MVLAEFSQSSANEVGKSQVGHGWPGAVSAKDAYTLSSNLSISRQDSV